MLQLATVVVPESTAREPTLPRRASPHRSAGKRRSARQSWSRLAASTVAINSERHLQQLTRPSQILPAPGIGEQPIVTDAVKAAGQNMQQEAAHELVGSRASSSCSASCPWRGSPSSGR